MYRMYRILEIEGEGNRDESDAALVERYAFYAEDREAFSASFSPRIRFKAGTENRQGGKWMDRWRWSNREGYRLSTRRQNREARGQKIVHFGEQKERWLYPVLRTMFEQRSTTIELAWTDTREYSILENNLDSRRGQRILRSILSRVDTRCKYWSLLYQLVSRLLSIPGKRNKEKKKKETLVIIEGITERRGETITG